MENVSVGEVSKETDFPARKVYRFSKDNHPNPKLSNSISVVIIFSTLTCTTTIRFTGKTLSRFKRPLKTQQSKCTLKELIKRSYKRKFVDIWFGMPLSGYKSTLFSPGETFPAIERLEQANVPVSYRKILSFPKRFKLDASNSDAKE